MGRIKTQLTKRLTMQLLKEHKEDLKDNFEENKKIVGNLLNNPGKKIRNVVAGYVTRLIKTKKETMM